MTRLSVNLNAVALLRNRRDLPWPSLTGVARTVLDAGADGITVHPRPDERHIRRTDVSDLATLLRADYPEAEFNIEGYPSADFLDLVESARPDQVTFVPDDPAQATSDHGWDFGGSARLLEPAVARMRQAGIRVSLFIDIDPSAPPSAWTTGADRIELYTGPYQQSFETQGLPAMLEAISATAEAARRAGHNARGRRPGLGINAGHDLTLENLPALRRAVPDLAEVSIGHAITADALLLGFPEAVRRYKALLR